MYYKWDRSILRFIYLITYQTVIFKPKINAFSVEGVKAGEEPDQMPVSERRWA